ncbi:MAG: DNA repair protein RadA [Alphaproteobacteria bacterium]|nr:MAG: DNA repair protein RadA [Alphaproteobacteria bacterium]
MAKDKSSFVCQSCGSSFPKWMGKCEACGGWNTLTEEVQAAKTSQFSRKIKSSRKLEFSSLQAEDKNYTRAQSGVNEFDRVCGGGLVPGSVILIGGDPGIGKSTLLLQVVAKLSGKLPCAYISGEESMEQIRLRARRLQVESAPVELASATNVGDIIAAIDRADGPKVVVVDSVQTLYLEAIESSPGTVSQVRASAHELIRVAKARGFVLFLVGHVTKEGTIAGPRVLEHMVDTVLYFEGERGHHFRILRAVKNRFGAADEIGVFSMTELGLQEVPNPSALFLSERRGDVSGSAVFAGMEGTRPVLVEVQALVNPTNFGTPRRTVIGWDAGRLSMLAAVLEARCGIPLSNYDIYLNIAGGIRITEPAADLAVAAALTSALSGTSIASDTVLFGEIGLSGEVRSVSQIDQRIKEAAKLGFKHAFLPKPMQGRNYQNFSGIGATSIENIHELLQKLGLRDGLSSRKSTPRLAT